MTTPKGSSSNQPDPNEFRTSDLYFAAFLAVSGARLAKTDRHAGKVTFVFDVTIVDIQGLKHAWADDSGRVPANSFSAKVKSLKSLCHML